MDLAQMLVVGGCAVIGASLGVTFWRVSQSGLFKRLTSKKKKSSPEEADLADNEGIEDAEVISADVTDSEVFDETIDLETDGIDEENQGIDPDLLSEIEAAAEEPEDDDEEDEFTVSFDNETDDATPPEPIEEGADQVEEVEAAAVSDAADGSLEFQEKTAVALTQIAERLGDALVRLERLENSVEAQFSGVTNTPDAPELGLLADDIEISELPISPAPSEPNAEELADIEPDRATEIPENDGATVAKDGEDEFVEGELDDVTDPSAFDDTVDVTVEDKEDADVGDETDGDAVAMSETVEAEPETEDPLDLPRVIGI